MTPLPACPRSPANVIPLNGPSALLCPAPRGERDRSPRAGRVSDSPDCQGTCSRTLIDPRVGQAAGSAADRGSSFDSLSNIIVLEPRIDQGIRRTLLGLPTRDA